MEDWNAVRYLQFEAERTRPASDLLARAADGAVARAIDLGCGPGNSTELLTKRFPRADIRGLDSSEDMLKKARQRLPHTAFDKADIADVESWRGGGPFDLIFANAVLQWIPNHIGLMARLVSELTPGGRLAVQMPDNLEEPSHALMRKVAARPPFDAKLAGAASARERIGAFADYYSALAPAGGRIDLWRTTYVHALQGADAIVEWVESTGLRPFLAPLTAGERQAFLSQYREEVALAYPPLADGRALLPFPRLFIVARRCENDEARVS